MIILTDAPEWTNSLLADFPAEEKTGCRAEDQSALSTAEQILWQALSGDTEVWRWEVAPIGPAAYWDYLIIIDTSNESQFDVLRELNSESLPGAVACIAATGNNFHGHNNRPWQAHRGNLHLSTACDPRLNAHRCGLAMTALPAVAVMDALENIAPWTTRPGIKWVNDVLMDSSKVAGVLTATGSVQETMNSLFLGIGLNVDFNPTIEPTCFVPVTGCLNRFTADGKVVSLGSALWECLVAISKRLEAIQKYGPNALVAAYQKHSLVVNRQVTIWPDSSTAGLNKETSEPLARGKVTGINEDFSLNIEGVKEPVYKGRLVLEKSTPRGVH